MDADESAVARVHAGDVVITADDARRAQQTVWQAMKALLIAIVKTKVAKFTRVEVRGVAWYAVMKGAVVNVDLDGTVFVEGQREGRGR